MRTLSFLVAAAAIIVSTATRAQEPATYQTTDEQLSDQSPLQTLQNAKSFALEHPESLAAARAGLDWYVAATILNSAEEIKSARLYLLLEHPLSLQGRFIYGTLLATPAKLGEYLLEEFSRGDRVPDVEFLRKYARAARLAPPGCQGASSTNAGYVLTLAAITQIDTAQTSPLTKQQWRAVLAANDKSGEKVGMFDILAEEGVSTAQKFHALQKYKSDKLGPVMQRALFTKLCERNQARPPEIRTHAENLLTGRQFPEAAQWLDKIPPEARDAQLEYWHGWSLVAAGQREPGVRKLEELAAQQAADPWGQVAKTLAAAIRADERNVQDLSQSLHAAVRRYLQKPLQRFEANITLLNETKTGELLQAYVAFDAPGAHMELVLQQRGAIQFAYKSTNGECSIYSSENPAIRKYARGGVVFLGQAYLTDVARGMNFHWNGNFVPRLPEDLNIALQPILSSPFFATPENLAEGLARAAASGIFLEKTPTAESANSAVWIVPEVAAPRLQRCGWKLDDDGKLASCRFDRLRLDKIRWGSTADFEFAPPAWPALPVADGEEFPPSESLAILTAVMKLAFDPQPIALKPPGTSSQR